MFQKQKNQGTSLLIRIFIFLIGWQLTKEIGLFILTDFYNSIPVQDKFYWNGLRSLTDVAINVWNFIPEPLDALSDVLPAAYQKLLPIIGVVLEEII